MKRILLIRHGLQIRGKDEGLADLGKKQADATGKYLGEQLAESGIAGLHASDLQRANETADRIATEIGQTPLVSELLRERMNWGDVDPDEPFEDFKQLWKQTLDERELQPLGRESSIQSGERLDGFLQSLPDDERPHVVVAHGGLFAELLRNKFPMDEIGAKMPHFPNIGEKGWKGFSHCSISELIIDDEGGYHMEGLNSTGHLESGIGEGIVSGGHQEMGFRGGKER